MVPYATSVIAPSKVELGVPLYGYNWSKKGTTSVQWDQASALRIAHNAALVFDTASQSPTFTYRAGGVKHTVWFENARSLGPRSPSRTATTWVPSGSGTSGTSHRRCGRCCAASTADPEVRMTIAERRARFRALHEHEASS